MASERESPMRSDVAASYALGLELEAARMPAASRRHEFANEVRTA